MARQVEVEWQFVVRDIGRLGRWLLRARFDGWSVSPSGVLGLRDTYLDTVDWRVHRAGYALRVRRSGDRVEATLKALGRARNGVACRREITERLPGARTSSLRVAPGVVGARLSRVIGERALRRLFALRTRRWTYVVRRDGRPIAELALDRTLVVPVRGRTRRIERVEVEVGAGPPALVASFVALLRRQRHLTIARCSKFEEGLAAARLVPPRRR
jgi:triphosphatase